MYTLDPEVSGPWPQPPLTTAQFVSDALATGPISPTLFNVSTNHLWGVWLFSVQRLPNDVDVSHDPVAFCYCAVASLNASSVFLKRWNVSAVVAGNPPIDVPSYLRRPDPPNDNIFTALGVIAVVFTLVQAGYGIYYTRLTSGTLKKKDPESVTNDDDK